MARQFAIGGKKMLQETLAHNRIRGERRACHKMNTTTKEKMKTKQDSLTHSSSSSCSCNHVLSWTQEKSREKNKTGKRMTSLKRTNTKKGAPKISTRETKNNEDTPNKSGRNSQGKSQRRGVE